VELQGTGEHAAFTRQQLDDLVDLGDLGIGLLDELQQAAYPDGAGLIDG
jgi:ribonuclease PH